MKLTLIVLCCISQAIAAEFVDSYPISFPPQSPSGRIIRGTDAKEGAVPFQCSVHVDRMHYCGCAIISPKWIVTAALCVYLQSPRNMEIYVGSTTLNGNGTYYKAEKFIAHDQYNRPPTANDIAVIRVQEPITFTDKVQPIELSSEEVPDGAVVQLTGWGAVRGETTSPLSKQLQIINLVAMPTARCKNIYLGLYVHDSHICTSKRIDEGACKGDYGSPLVYKNKLVGVVNWAQCAGSKPDVYAKVEYLFDWIKGNTASD